jgi:hypothetical protein
MLESLPEEEVDGKWLPLPKEKDKPIKLIDQIAMLNEVGIHAVDIVHKRINFVLTLAHK